MFSKCLSENILGINCWIATDEDGRDKQVGIAFRFGLLYAQSKLKVCLKLPILSLFLSYFLQF